PPVNALAHCRVVRLRMDRPVLVRSDAQSRSTDELCFHHEPAGHSGNRPGAVATRPCLISARSGGHRAEYRLTIHALAAGHRRTAPAAQMVRVRGDDCGPCAHTGKWAADIPAEGLRVYREPRHSRRAARSW